MNPALHYNARNNTAHCPSCGAVYTAEQTRRAERGDPPVGVMVTDDGRTLRHNCAIWLDFQQVRDALRDQAELPEAHLW